MWNSNKRSAPKVAENIVNYKGESSSLINFLVKGQTRKRPHETDNVESSNNEVKAAKRSKSLNKQTKALDLHAEISKLGIDIDENEFSQLISDQLDEKEQKRRQFPNKKDFEHVEYEATDPFWTPANPALFKTDDVCDSLTTIGSDRLITQGSDNMFIPCSSRSNLNRNEDATSSQDNHKEEFGKSFKKVHKTDPNKREKLVLNRMSVQEINAILANRGVH